MSEGLGRKQERGSERRRGREGWGKGVMEGGRESELSSLLKNKKHTYR